MITWNKDKPVSIGLRLTRGFAMGVVIFSGMGLMHPSFEPIWIDQAMLYVALVVLIASFIKIEA